MYCVYVDSKKEETANVRCKRNEENYKLFCFYFLYKCKCNLIYIICVCM